MDQHAPATIDIALHLLDIPVVGTVSIAGVILWVFPYIIWAFLHTIVLEIEVSLYAREAGVFASALSTRGCAINTLLLVECVGGSWALDIALAYIDVRI